MNNCPICGTADVSRFCRSCGYDLTTDAVSFPTLCPIPEPMVSQRIKARRKRMRSIASAAPKAGWETEPQSWNINSPITAPIGMDGGAKDAGIPGKPAEKPAQKSADFEAPVLKVTGPDSPAKGLKNNLGAAPKGDFPYKIVTPASAEDGKPESFFKVPEPGKGTKSEPAFKVPEPNKGTRPEPAVKVPEPNKGTRPEPAVKVPEPNKGVKPDTGVLKVTTKESTGKLPVFETAADKSLAKANPAAPELPKKGGDVTVFTEPKPARKMSVGRLVLIIVLAVLSALFLIIGVASGFAIAGVFLSIICLAPMLVLILTNKHQ